MCEHADLCSLSLSLSLAQLSVVAISLLPSAPRFLEHWPHSPKLSLCALPVCSIPGRVTQCFFLHVSLFEHAQLLVLLSTGGPVPGKFASGDLLGNSEPMSPQLPLPDR